jgi:choline dehydrogenase-like flavoprotein
MTNPSLEADIVIVGSGPAGAVFAKRAAEAGLSVIWLVQGGLVDFGNAKSVHPEFVVSG